MRMRKIGVDHNNMPIPDTKRVERTQEEATAKQSEKGAELAEPS